jgi:hypothetical protein
MKGQAVIPGVGGMFPAAVGEPGLRQLVAEVRLARSRLIRRAVCGKRGRNEYLGQQELAGGAG